MYGYDAKTGSYFAHAEDFTFVAKGWFMRAWSHIQCVYIVRNSSVCGYIYHVHVHVCANPLIIANTSALSM